MAILKKDLIQKIFTRFDELHSKEVGYYFDDKWLNRTEFTEKEVNLIKKDMELLTKGFPLAQITGIAHFYGHRFVVDKNVLIPRPETEELVEWVLQSSLSDKRILDIGTGSGCIPITLSIEAKVREIHAWEVSKHALHMAQKNAELHDVHDIQWKLLDVLSLNSEDLHAKWDIIISNPPYVRRTETDESILYEPEVALFVPEEDPILFYKRIASWAIQSLSDGGHLFFELSEFTYQEVAAYVEDLGFNHIEVRKDLQGKHRMLRAVKSDECGE